MILTVAHTKGGVGKSTLAWNIANCLISEYGQKVKIIDLDFQQTIFFINHIRSETGLDQHKVIQCETAADLIHEFETYKDDEILIVDVGGFDNDINRTAISWSDQIIVPISNSLTEVLGFKTFEAILEEIGNPFVNVVLNNIHPLTRDFDVITKAIGESENISLKNSIIRNRKVYKETLGRGKSVFDVSDEVAKAEIKGLCDELTSNW
ncbi:hypothetical protein CPG37_04455 [Malaciobacter canalis]|uniref:CobQ/CobB/MinD/ParA nucleotide binding domain-containing protein n=1 Tax=Malaciobacter canalis TaxID=1912871 RepID=A0ABX4LRE3_9BACT|nr:ParA family protein [Malaciobacter canalis]PHO10303.1 hypothetical protein CPG37_04455 [Malaciobacter canalis]QEE32408.1 ParA-like protein [Malaciobacter canalis]